VRPTESSARDKYATFKYDRDKPKTFAKSYDDQPPRPPKDDNTYRDTKFVRTDFNASGKIKGLDSILKSLLQAKLKTKALVIVNSIIRGVAASDRERLELAELNRFLPLKKPSPDDINLVVGLMIENEFCRGEVGGWVMDNWGRLEQLSTALSAKKS
jgi:hypothetical protein